ncbi:transglutaminase family protein [Synechococcus sp. RSCCF101]|uniref:transglutaminase-like domain-containing protein n=1 Tax=Synechococcus sp. RSCCF101 TaxID=2511069 RepID=UPI001CD9ED00|nr:transglutaminase family protein [Synechococcus sp. RSCCF101]
MQLAHELWHETAADPLAFLWQLNQRIFDRCSHEVRHQGDPYPPSVTWSSRQGSCRDMAVLFMDVCRAMGLACRFVSGYQEGDPDWEYRHLHAWVEVYLPGGGWRGYDPTHGLAVADRHIALVAAPCSRLTAPVSGNLRSGIGAVAHLEHQLSIACQAAQSPAAA